MTENINKILLTIQEKLENKQNPNYDKLPYELKTNKDFILEVLKLESKYLLFYHSIYRELKSIFGLDPNLEKLRADPDIIEASFKASKGNVGCMPEDKITLKMAKDVANAGCFYILPKKFQDNDDIFNIFINILKVDFYIIEQCDEDIISKAFIELVNQSFDFLTNPNIRYAFVRIIPKLNKEAIKYLAKVNPLYINKSSFNDDEEVALYLLKGDHVVFEHFSKRLKSNKPFVQKAMNINPKIWTSLPKELLQDPELIYLKDKLFKPQNIKVGEWGEYI